eukprot:5336002-Amphidinium_carterae.1
MDIDEPIVIDEGNAAIDGERRKLHSSLSHRHGLSNILIALVGVEDFLQLTNETRCCTSWRQRVITVAQ